MEVEFNRGEPANVLLVVDRSHSMSGLLNEGTATRWEIMRHAVIDVTKALDTGINWGLILFPAGTFCEPGVVNVGIGSGTATEIAAELDSSYPGGSTPTDATLRAALTALQSIPINDRNLVVATDGEAACGDDAASLTLAAVEDLANAAVTTYVIGFGPLTVGLPLLDQMAELGGTTASYNAQDSAELVATLRAIAGEIVGLCTYPLETVPSDPDDLEVSFDDEFVPRDPARRDGWEYDGGPDTVTFYGAYCDLLSSGEIERIHFDLGCAGAGSR